MKTWELYSKLRVHPWIRSEFPSFIRFPFRSVQEIQRDQEDRLKHLLRIAVNRVPYYKDIHVDFDHFSIAELQKFPVVTKKMMLERIHDFQSTTISNEQTIESHTSGSTGEQFRFLLPIKSDQFENLTMFRAWNMGGHYQIGDPVIMLRSFAPQPNEPLYRVNRKYNWWYLSAFDLSAENLSLYLDVIERSNSALLRGYPSSIYIFTLLLSEKGIRPLSQIKTIITSSETLLPIYRKTIEEYWGIGVQDWYGLNERVVTVQQCEHGTYHNNDDYGIIEVDERNHIIGTSLFNEVMPFIRYDTEDLADRTSTVPEQCSCKRNFSIPFIGIQGRSDDLLYKSDGTPIPTVNIYTAMHEFDKLKQFKIIQQQDLTLTVQLVLRQSLSETESRAILHELETRLGSLPMRIEKVDTIPRDPRTGKVKACESYYKPSSSL